jgi:lipoprotein-releasing system permease protein
MSFEWFVARRYLTARRRQAFISLITAVSVLGVGVGVAAVIIALALMTGAQGELRDRILGADAHIYLYHVGGPFPDPETEVARLRQRDGVVGAAPAMIGDAILNSPATDRSEAVQVRGIDPALERTVTEIGSAVKAGSIDALVNRSPDAPYGIVIGTRLAESLGVGVGDMVQMLTLSGVATPFGTQPRRRAFEVVGLVEFGFEETDARRAYLALDQAAAVLSLDGPSLILLRLADRDDSVEIRDRLNSELGPAYLARDWTDLNASLYSALGLEKLAISFTIGLIVFVAALNIVGSLVLMVMDKSRDIAILRTMGASASAIRRIFMLQGMTIGLVGTAAGTVLGLGVSFVMDRYKLLALPSDVYQITYVPFRNEPLDVTVVVVAAMLICYLATVYPSRQAGRLDPAEALRHQ